MLPTTSFEKLHNADPLLGPWAVEADRRSNYLVDADDAFAITSDRWDIAAVWKDAGSEAEVKANARLIAAAPDLFSIAKRWAALDGGAWHTERYAAEREQLLRDTKAAIGKASS